jgi:hypothetical protein
VKFTTPAPLFDVEALFPFLQGQGREAWRLHPRPKANLPLDISKFGGRFRFPKSKTLPYDPYTERLAVPVLQFQKTDFPKFDFFGEADWVQIFWATDDMPTPLMYWHTNAELEDSVILEATQEDKDDPSFVYECVLHPEKIIEYPDISSLYLPEQEMIWAWEEQLGAKNLYEEGAVYQSYLSTCEDSKVGGYPYWAGQDARVPNNKLGKEAPYCLTICDNTWGQPERWQPIEQIAPPRGRKHIEVHGEYKTQTWIFSPEEELLMEQWTLERKKFFFDDHNAIGTYLKEPMNIFLDKTVSPWQALTSY